MLTRICPDMPGALYLVTLGLPVPSAANLVPPSPAECRMSYCFCTLLPDANAASTLPASDAVPVTFANVDVVE